MLSDDGSEMRVAWDLDKCYGSLLQDAHTVLMLAVEWLQQSTQEPWSNILFDVNSRVS
jgi:hypothetical protein